MIDQLHYITQEINGLSHDQMAERACEEGVKWVQLRMKEKTAQEQLEIALKTQAVCHRYGARLLINDHVQLAREIGADGVHLGQQDMCPAEARAQLPRHMIIGGTANTFEQVQILAKKKVDYMGVGPFRFTTTKQKLSPVLGLKGYNELLTSCIQSNILQPIIAIGGIEVSDISALRRQGVHGVAIASLINTAEHPAQVIQNIKKALHYDESLTNS